MTHKNEAPQSPADSLPKENQNVLKPIEELIQTVHRLRAPDGCPWDREQTHQSIRQYFIEETYETIEVLDQIDKPEDVRKEQILGRLREELGDVLLQVLLHSEMADEQKAFNFVEVAKALNEKLIRRHPHVFGETRVKDSEHAFQSWEKQKAKEKASKPDASVLDGVPKGLPAVQRATRVIEKVTKVGFQWTGLEGPLSKVDEELGELKAEIELLQKAGSDPAAQSLARKKIGHELGDLFFSICNLAHMLRVSPEDSFRGTIQRFESRFRHVEKRLKEIGKTPEQSTLEEMDRYWDEAKRLGRESGAE
ncbi:MAG: nucleoside triphosphate pyrophosphohydrolase [Bdellovibrionales bacterium GWB1_55_8]|nr:MAG: nucleoside triphosphate pyrophosphohydrolase [Bdellovibrionales bacterium GWB1_55_8]